MAKDEQQFPKPLNHRSLRGTERGREETLHAYEMSGAVLETNMSTARLKAPYVFVQGGPSKPKSVSNLRIANT